MAKIETGVRLSPKTRYVEAPVQYANGYALGVRHRYVVKNSPPPVVDSFTEGYDDGMSGKQNRYGARETMALNQTYRAITPGQCGIVCDYHYWHGNKGVQFPTPCNPLFRAFSYCKENPFFRDVKSFDIAEEIIHPTVWC